VYLSIGIYIKFFGNIKTFYCSNNPVQEIANSLCDLKYCVRRLHVLCVMLLCCHEPLSSCCRMVRRPVIGRGVAGREGGREGVRTASWVPLHNYRWQCLKLNSFLLSVFINNLIYSSLKKDSVKEFFTINID
jgi:hypothetical protein